MKIPSATMVFPGFEPDQKVDDTVDLLKQFDADGKKKLADGRSIAIVATPDRGAGSIDNSHEPDENMWLL
ncbi:hypothetical protein [Bosea thiooxidans]